MSANSFLKGKSRKIYRKKKDDKGKKKKPKLHSEPNLQNGEESSESDLDLKKFSDVEDESDHETAEHKKLRLAKKYLEEIKREEEKRAELAEDDAVDKRLQRDYLESQGKLKVQVADNYTQPTKDSIRVIRAREHRLTLTCVCISSEGQYVFTGSKCGTLVKWGVKEKRKLGCLTHKTHSKLLKGSIMSIAISSDTKYLATSDESNNIQIWDPITLKHLHTFNGHKNIVTGIVFRKNTHELYSASKDRCVKIWSLDEMAYVETLFGHQSAINSIDALTKERAITAGGTDTSVRIWKIVEESQLIFNGPIGSIDEVKLLDEDHFVSGGDNGTLCVWSIFKKKPLCSVLQAHGAENEVPRWITALATLINSDIFASGSHDNNIRVWKVCDMYRKVLPMFSIEVDGCVNSIQFTPDGRHLYAAVGQEHKWGRWFKVGTAKNSLLIVNFNLKS